jgi:hypothetical protein
MSMKTQNEYHELGQLCDETDCQDCCPHYETDHSMCMDCGKELDPGIAIDRAMSYYEDQPMTLTEIQAKYGPQNECSCPTLISGHWPTCSYLKETLK